MYCFFLCGTISSFIILFSFLIQFIDWTALQQAWSPGWIPFWRWTWTATKVTTWSSTQVSFYFTSFVAQFWTLNIMFFVFDLFNCHHITYLTCDLFTFSFPPFNAVDAIPSPYLAYETPAGPPITDDGNANAGASKRSSSSGGASRWVRFWWCCVLLNVLLIYYRCGHVLIPRFV